MTNQSLIRIAAGVATAILTMLIILYIRDPEGLRTFRDSIATAAEKAAFPQHFNY